MVAPELIPVQQLQSLFQAEGWFYQLDGHRCRSVLEIRTINAQASTRPEAIFVMMNPGGSRPIDSTVCIHANASMGTLVLAHPDDTQYQLMRLMLAMEWRHVRVINLSDLCATDSRAFARKAASLEGQSGHHIHSVFAPERTAELRTRLDRCPGAPIACAWGVGNHLRRHIARAIQSLANERLIGYAKPGMPDRFYHPLRRPKKQQQDWLEQMYQLIRRHTATRQS